MFGWVRTFFLLFILAFCQNDAVEVAADEITQDDADIDRQDGRSVGFPEVERHAEVVECICHAVGESADDEERHAEKEGQILFLTGKLHGGGHDEAAADTEESAFQSSGAESEFEDILSGILNGERSHAGQKGGQKAADDIAQEDKEKSSDLVFLYESGCSGIESELISYHCQESEGEEDRSDK